LHPRDPAHRAAARRERAPAQDPGRGGMKGDKVMTNTRSTQVREPGEVERTRERPRMVPLADIHETEGTFELRAAMPGVDPKSIEVTLEARVLTLRGTTSLEVPDGHRRVWAEFEPGDWARSFELTDAVDEAGITASTRNGVLTVQVPKKKPAQRR